MCFSPVREAWGEFENAAPVERLDLQAELARWSGVGTAGRIVPDIDIDIDIDIDSDSSTDRAT